MALTCTRLSTRTTRPVVFSSDEELNEIILSEYQQEAENTTLTITCDSSRTRIGPETITCTRIGTNQVDWRPTPIPTCVLTQPDVTSVTGTLNQQQQIMIGAIVGGIVLLAIIIGILVYKFCWPFKERVKRTTRIIKRHHYLEESKPEPKQDVVEYVQSLPAEPPPSYGYIREPVAPEPVPAPIQYIEAPMQVVQAPVQMEQPVQMVQEQVFQQPVQMIQEPTQMIYEQPMSVMQMPQQSRQIEAPMMYEQPMTVIQPPVHMPRQTRQHIVQAPMMYEQQSNVMQAPLQAPIETRQIVEAPIMYEQSSNMMQAPLQMPRETRQLVEAPMMYEQPLNVMHAPVQMPRESRQIIEVPERRFQSQMMVVPSVVPEVQHVRYENHRNQRKPRVIRREYNHRQVGPSVRAISASEHANLKPSKYFVQEPMEEFVTYDKNGRGRTALETMGREGHDGWRTVEAPLRSRTQRNTSRSHHPAPSRVIVHKAHHKRVHKSSFTS
ncbi:unnamed protein product [Owenia fusiformis]|uniref:Uncharacterized protein n=1 Tax=Owenia fusiformis TaxID=6347 RepID=A0A8S4P1M4_OWEFU|nr:unnamed protein product [Owenia fusiformis]